MSKLELVREKYEIPLIESEWEDFNNKMFRSQKKKKPISSAFWSGNTLDMGQVCKGGDGAVFFIFL